MRFVSVHELRNWSANAWRRLAYEPDMVITSNGRPVAILSAVSSEGLEESLAALRRARAIAAVEVMQSRSVAAGKHRMSRTAIGAEIAAVRKGRLVAYARCTTDGGLQHEGTNRKVRARNHYGDWRFERCVP